MAVPEKRLLKKQKEKIPEINEWTAEQFRKKNISLSNNKDGIHLVDRCPLDPLTFGRASERRTKAKHLLEKITDGKQHGIEKGHLIYLDGDVSDIQQRSSYKHKYWSPDEIEELVNNINAVYKEIDKTTICTRGRTIADVARQIAKVIFIGKYQEVDVEERLGSFSNSRGF